MEIRFSLYDRHVPLKIYGGRGKNQTHHQREDFIFVPSVSKSKLKLKEWKKYQRKIGEENWVLVEKYNEKGGEKPDLNSPEIITEVNRKLLQLTLE